MTPTFGLILVIAAAVMLGVAGLLIVITFPDPEPAKWYYALLAFGAACGFVGVKVP